MSGGERLPKSTAGHTRLPLAHKQPMKGVTALQSKPSAAPPPPSEPPTKPLPGDRVDVKHRPARILPQGADVTFDATEPGAKKLTVRPKRAVSAGGVSAASNASSGMDLTGGQKRPTLLHAPAGPTSPVTSAAQKAVPRAVVKGAGLGAARLAAFVPVAGAAIQGMITVRDFQIAQDIHADRRASRLSKELAKATLMLDGVALGALATGALAPAGWVAGGMSIVTGVLRDAAR